MTLKDEEIMMRFMEKRAMKLTGLAAVVAMALSACSGAGAKTETTSPDGAKAKQDLITAQVAYANLKFDPTSTSGALPLAANWHVTEGLYDLDMKTYEVHPALAAGEPEVISDTEIKVTLRKDAKFSNGDPVTPADVQSSFARTMKKGGLYLSMLNFIESVEPSGDNAVVIKFNKKFPLAKKRISLVRIVPAKATEQELTAKPIGTGPWKYESINEQQVKFKVNENYNGSKPAAAKEMVWNVNVDDTARVTAMQQGNTDVMENVPAKAFSTLQSSNSKIETVQGFNQAFIMFNTKKAPFDNKLARQAILYAIDTQKLIQNQLSGQADPATSFLPKSFANYHKAKNVYTHDLDKAKDLMKQAGVNGPLNITLYTTDHKWITDLAPQIKNNIEAIGASVKLESMKSSALYPNITDKDNADFSIVLAPGDPSVFGNDPDLLMNWWYGDNVWTHKRTFWYGSEGYNNLHKAMDQALLSEGAQQQQSWNECFDILSEEVPLYPLFHRKVSTAVKNDTFKKFDAIGTTGLTFLNAELK